MESRRWRGTGRQEAGSRRLQTKYCIVSYRGRRWVTPPLEDGARGELCLGLPGAGDRGQRRDQGSIVRREGDVAGSRCWRAVRMGCDGLLCCGSRSGRGWHMPFFCLKALRPSVPEISATSLSALVNG